MNELWLTLLEATIESVYMLLVSAFFAVLIGLPLGLLLVAWQKKGISENIPAYRICDMAINILRSVPFAILILIVLPLTLLIVGRRTGTTATIVPLVISAFPFVARLTEQSINSLDKGIYEVARAMGLNKYKILFKVLLPEALPNLIQGITIMLITLFGYSAMAGAIGGGGLGNLALRFGYHRRDTFALWMSVIVSVLLVQLIQLSGNFLTARLDRK